MAQTITPLDDFLGENEILGEDADEEDELDGFGDSGLFDDEAVEQLEPDPEELDDGDDVDGDDGDDVDGLLIDGFE